MCYPFFFSTITLLQNKQPHSLVSLQRTTIFYSYVRTVAIMVLNSYIVIFSTTKTQNVPRNSEAKVIFFGSTATVHSYFWLCTVTERFFFFFCLRSHYFSYFFILSSAFHYPLSSLPLPLLLSSSTDPSPICMSPAAIDPSSLTHARLPTLADPSWPLFSIFDVCACVLA